jgi:integrase
VWSWVQGRREREAAPEAIRKEMPRSFGWMLFFLQETGARYEEMAHAEFPLEGPFVRLDKSAGTLTIIGKGREGGKLRTVTLTKEQSARLGELVAWRSRLTKLLRERTKRDPAPRLFVTLSDSTKASGNPLSETAGTWNETLKTWARRYNDWCEKNGRKDRAIDPDLCTSHKIGRAVSITKLAREGVAEKVLMQERGIEDHNTVERYIRFSTEDRRSMLEAAEKSLARRSNGSASAAPLEGREDAGSGNVNRAVLEELRALRETVDELRVELKEKDKRISELTDRILAPAR